MVIAEIRRYFSMRGGKDGDKFYLLTSVFVEYDERVEVGGKAS
jgi:hypothetical protein